MQTVKVENGIVRKILSTETIPVEHILGDLPKNGYYMLSPATCGGACSIGCPKQKCLDNGIYSPRKCAGYSLYPTRNSDIL